MKKYTSTQLMNLLLQDNQWFDIFRTRSDQKNMLRSLYNMRHHHGLMAAVRYGLAQELQNPLGDQRQTNEQLVELSTTDSLCQAAVQLIMDTETILREDLMDPDLGSLAKMDPIDLGEFTEDGSLKLDPVSEAPGVGPEGTPPAVDEVKYFPLEEMEAPLDDARFAEIVRQQTTKDAITCGQLDINHPTIVNFYTEWCGYSRQLAPIWNGLQEDYCAVPINFLKINCEEKKDFCQRFQIRSYPTIKLLTENEIINFPSQVPRTPETIKAFIKKHTGLEA